MNGLICLAPPRHLTDIGTSMSMPGWNGIALRLHDSAAIFLHLNHRGASGYYSCGAMMRLSDISPISPLYVFGVTWK
jgi:hypothetical protein